MSIADSIRKHVQSSDTKIDSVLSDLDEQDRAAVLNLLLASPSEVGHTAISRGLRENGHDISEATVRRWREKNSTTEVSGL